MALSSNTLLHTTGKASLFGILEDFSFYPKFCVEKLSYPNGSYDLAFPMISFSDFPVTELKDRVSYGKYGLGLKKSWAKRNGLSPVFYLELKSTLLKEYVAHNKIMFKEMKEAWNNPAFENWYHFNYLILAHFKNYQGHLKSEKHNLDIPKYRYSDEREWRYVPPKHLLDKMGIRTFLPDGDYIPNKILYNNQLKEIKLRFKAEDINYIIVDRETEIIPLINHIDTHHISLSSKIRSQLYSRILSRTRLRYDF